MGNVITPPPVRLSDYVNTYSRFVIASHEKPDGDCICSTLALASFLRRIGKTVFLYNPGPFARKEIRQYKNLFSHKVPAQWMHCSAALILLDCASKERVCLDGTEFQEQDIAIIDHHPSHIDKDSVHYICSAAPSASLMVQALIEHMGTLNKQEAYYILKGFLTDSGFFRHLENAAMDALQYVSRLVSHQHSLRMLYKELYGDIYMNEMHFVSDIVLHSHTFLQGKLLVATRTKEMSKKYSISYLNGEYVNAQLQMIKGVEVTVLFTELGDDAYDVSLRASGKVNVATIAEEFGGGGHVAASGFRWLGTLDAIQMKLIQKVGMLGL